MRKRFYGGQNDEEFIVLLGYFYFEALVKMRLHFVLEFAGDGHAHASIVVNVFSLEITFLYKAIVDFYD